MKKGWTYKKLGEVCMKITDGSHNPPKGVEKSNNYMLSSQNVQNGYLDMTSVRYLSDENFRIENQRTQAKKGDVLLTIVGTIGRTCVLDGTEGNITFQRSVAILKPSEEINSRFLMFFLLSQNSNLNSTAQGAAQKGIYLKQLGNIELHYPPLSEQQQIVSRLDAAFANIDALKANAEKQLSDARQLFQAELTECMRPKEGWEEKTLGDICKVINGRAYSKDEMLKQGKYRLLRVGNFFTNDSWYYSDLELEEDKYCDNGDLLYAWSASFGPRIWNGEKVIYHYHIWKMVCSPVIDKYFMYYWLDSNELKNQTMSNLHGATMAHITKGIIEAANVCYPSISDQHRIVSHLDSLSAKVRELEEMQRKTLAECDALKQAMLREVFE